MTTTLAGLTFHVTGQPVPQGSVRSLGKGRPSVHGNAASLLPWRDSVAAAARAVHGDAEPLTGPLEVRIVFRLPRPKTAPRARMFPDGRPDLDKLERAILDACTAARMWGDDGQVVHFDAWKVYATGGETLGCDVTIAPAWGPR